MSEEGSYLPCRIAKVSHSSRILYTCIWKVPLNYYEEELQSPDSVNVECDEHVVIRTKPKQEWTTEQIEIIKTFSAQDQQWKFQFETFVDYNMSQNQLHDRCQKLARLGYRVDQIIGIQHSFQVKTAMSKVEPNIVQRTNNQSVVGSPVQQVAQVQESMNTTANSIKKQQPQICEIPIATPLAISQCISKTV